MSSECMCLCVYTCLGMIVERDWSTGRMSMTVEMNWSTGRMSMIVEMDWSTGRMSMIVERDWSTGMMSMIVEMDWSTGRMSIIVSHPSSAMCLMHNNDTLTSVLQYQYFLSPSLLLSFSLTHTVSFSLYEPHLLHFRALIFWCLDAWIFMRLSRTSG